MCIRDRISRCPSSLISRLGLGMHWECLKGPLLFHNCITVRAHGTPAAVWIFWKPGNPDFGKSGNPDFWDLGIQKFGVQKMEKIKILKIQICSAQNVGKVWISRKKILLALFGTIWGHFFHGPKKSKKCQNFAHFPWWANGPNQCGKNVLGTF